jgi:predicted DNA-binding protein (MmcQ/YjbR family)
VDVERIRAYCLAFPNATENLQWGDDLCFKIRGKIFATLALTAVPQKMCFKSTPEVFAELIEREDIAPAPYVGRYKWVILHRLDALRPDELEEFVRQSYEMVAANAPKTKSKASKPQGKSTGKMTRSNRARRPPQKKARTKRS